MFNRKVFILLVLMLSACAPATAIPVPVLTPTGKPPTATKTTAPTLTPTITPRPTATLTYEQVIQPYTIEGLRLRKYQSGTITVAGILEQTKDFTRYLINYPSDGLTIVGIMQIPAQGKPPFPVIVMNHGFFARTVYVSGDGTDRAAEFLNKRGYLTISSDYRSWGQSDYGPSLYYSGLAIDVVNLLNAIPSIPEADASRVGLWGHSMGGGVTMKVLTIVGGQPAARIKATVRAAVLYSTVSADQADVLARWGLGCFGDVLAGEAMVGCNSSDIVPLDLPQELLDAYYKSSTDPATLREISPIYHLDVVTAPVQIHYGTRDGEQYSGTPPEWSKKLYQAFLDAGKFAKLFAYDGERHSFIGDAWFAFMEETAKFFDEYVKNAK
jgi:dipeptidyl aminopeptidase/acylaminoacyl peptidase